MLKDIFQIVNFLSIMRETLMVTSFVIILMLLIEILNVATRESFVKFLNKSSIIQILAATILGLIPGCIGIFVVVALYSKRIISVGALIATLIATVGDEAFFMFAVMPRETLIIYAILSVIAIITGLLCDKFMKNKFQNSFSNIIHNKENCYNHSHRKHDCEDLHKNTFSLKNIYFSKYKIFVMSIILIIIVLTSTNFIGHIHSDFMENIKIDGYSEVETCNHLEHNLETCEASHEHQHAGNEGLVMKIILLSISALLFILILFSNEHFVKNHLWQHVILKHFIKIFIWIFATLIIIDIVLKFTDFSDWLNNNYLIVFLLAILIGIIPQSGPHLIFVALFVNGTIPFSILLVNSIVQDGHGGLPLIAENKKVFFFKKFISIAIAIVIGILDFVLGVI